MNPGHWAVPVISHMTGTRSAWPLFALTMSTQMFATKTEIQYTRMRVRDKVKHVSQPIEGTRVQLHPSRSIGASLGKRQGVKTESLTTVSCVDFEAFWLLRRKVLTVAVLFFHGQITASPGACRHEPVTLPLARLLPAKDYKIP